MKFRKHISLVLAFLILVSNVGMAFNVHYCGTKIASISLNSSLVPSSEKGCCEKIISKKDNCCKNKIVYFQKKSENDSFKYFSFPAPFFAVIQEIKPVVFNSNTNFKSIENTTYYCDANAPPLFKLYSQYIFYA